MSYHTPLAELHRRSTALGRITLELATIDELMTRANAALDAGQDRVGEAPIATLLTELDTYLDAIGARLEAIRGSRGRVQ